MTEEENVREIMIDNSVRVKEFLDFLVREMLGDPTIEYRIKTNLTPEGEVLFYVKVDAKYVGRIIGKEGRCANAIRELAKRKGKMTGNLRINVDVRPIDTKEDSNGKEQEG